MINNENQQYGTKAAGADYVPQHAPGAVPHMPAVPVGVPVPQSVPAFQQVAAYPGQPPIQTWQQGNPAYVQQPVYAYAPPVNQSPAYQPFQPVYQPAYQPTAPVFVSPHLQKDPRTSDAKSMFNKMAFLCAAQMGLSIFWQLIIMVIYGAVGINLLSVDDASFYWINAVLIPLSTLLPGLIYVWRTKPDISKMMRFENHGILASVFGIFGGLAICLLANYPAGFIRGVFEETGISSVEPEPSLFDPGSTWIYFLAVVILAPVMEEFIFRGVMFSLLEKHGTGFAVIGSGIIFGLAHMDFSSVIFATIAGFVFGYLYAKTRNLWVTIIVHFLNNAIAMVGTYANSLFGSDAALVQNLIFFVPIILGMLSLVFLVIFKRKTFFTLKDNKQAVPVNQYYGVQYAAIPLTAGESNRTIWTSLGFWLIFGFMAFYMVLSALLL